MMKDAVDNIGINGYDSDGLRDDGATEELLTVQKVLKLPFATGHGNAMARIRHADGNYAGNPKNENPCEDSSPQGL